MVTSRCKFSKVGETDADEISVTTDIIQVDRNMRDTDNEHQPITLSSRASNGESDEKKCSISSDPLVDAEGGTSSSKIGYCHDPNPSLHKPNHRVNASFTTTTTTCSSIMDSLSRSNSLESLQPYDTGSPVSSRTKKSSNLSTAENLRGNDSQAKSTTGSVTVSFSDDVESLEHDVTTEIVPIPAGEREVPQFTDWASNISFLSGSILYVCLAIWDVVDDYSTKNEASYKIEDTIYELGSYNSTIHYAHHADTNMTFDDASKVSLRTIEYNDENFITDDANEEVDANLFYGMWAASIFTPYVLLSACAALCYVIDASFQISRLQLCSRRVCCGLGRFRNCFHRSIKAAPHHQIADSTNYISLDTDNVGVLKSDALTTCIVHEAEGCTNPIHCHLHGFRGDVSQTPNGLIHQVDSVTIEEKKHYGESQQLDQQQEQGTDNNPTDHERKDKKRQRYLKAWWNHISGALIGATFGIAALSDLIGAFSVDEDAYITEVCGFISVHLYLLNAVLLTAPLVSDTCKLKSMNPRKVYHTPDDDYYNADGSTSRRRRGIPQHLLTTDNLEYFGDMLFLFGSVIDVLLIYWDLESTTTHVVTWFYLLSALLWLTDAIFYISADCIVCFYNQNNIEHDIIQQRSYNMLEIIMSTSMTFDDDDTDEMDTSGFSSNPSPIPMDDTDLSTLVLKEKTVSPSNLPDTVDTEDDLELEVV